MCRSLAISNVIFVEISGDMKPFLKQVAEHYYNKGDIERRCFVFPNRRSMAFFMKWLSEAVADADILKEDGIVAIRTLERKEMPEEMGNLVKYRAKTYGISTIHFYCDAADLEEDEDAEDEA